MTSYLRCVCNWLLCSLSPVLLSLTPSVSSAWNATGHMVVASIAYQQLKPAVKEKVDAMTQTLSSEYENMKGFTSLAFWPDSIRGQRIEIFTHWHYINLPYSPDDTTPMYNIDTDNAVWALKMIRPIVKNNRANPFERARFLAFLIHITGDLHQPLHSVSLFSERHQTGDRGGNLYNVIYQGQKMHIHKLWDRGITAFDVSKPSPEKADEIAKLIMQLYPKTSFSQKSLDDVDPDHWAQEGLSTAKKYVYSTPEDDVVSTAYIQRGTKEAQREAALAGYRLGNLLNSLLS